MHIQVTALATLVTTLTTALTLILTPMFTLLYAYPGVADSTEFDREILPYTLPYPHHTITSYQHILSTHPINIP